MALRRGALEEMEEELGCFAAIAESSFARRDDGALLFFPWGSDGRGYEIRSEREHRRLRRELAWILAIAFFSAPTAAMLLVESWGLVPLLVLPPLLGLVLIARIHWLTRPLPPCADRISRDEGRARLAAALSPRRIRRVTRFFLALGAISLLLLLAGRSAEALVACIASAIGAAGTRWQMSSQRERRGR